MLDTYYRELDDIDQITFREAVFNSGLRKIFELWVADVEDQLINASVDSDPVKHQTQSLVLKTQHSIAKDSLNFLNALHAEMQPETE